MTVDLAVAVLLAGLTAYAVLGGADYGGGFWDLTAGGAERGARVRGLVQRSIAPVWEANHVWLIFVLVVLWTAFPAAFGPVMRTLYVPLFLAAVGIILRGSGFILRGEAATIGEARLLGAQFAISSVLTPFFLGTAVGAVASGRVPPAGAGDPWTSWTGATPLFAGALAVVVGAYLSAVFLAGDAERAGLEDLVRAFRARALGAGVVAGAVAIAGLVLVHEDARELFDGLTSSWGLALVVASALAGLATLGLLYAGRFNLARFAAAAAVGAVVVGLGVALRPYFLPSGLTLDEAAATDNTLVPLLISLAVGALVLVPSLTVLYRLTLRGRLDPPYRPITSGLRQRRQRRAGRDEPGEEER